MKIWKSDFAIIPLDVKAGHGTYGYVVDRARELEADLDTAYEKTILPVEADLDSVNEWLLSLRKEWW